MLIEVEILDQDIKNYIESYCKSNLRSGYRSMDFTRFLDEQVKKALIKAFSETDFMDLIETNCREVALEEINKAAKQKTPGWVRQQMKEMLKYARAEFWKASEELKP